MKMLVTFTYGHKSDPIPKFSKIYLDSKNYLYDKEEVEAILNNEVYIVENRLKRSGYRNCTITSVSILEK